MSTWQDLFDTNPQGAREFVDPRTTHLSTIYDFTLFPTDDMAEPSQCAPAIYDDFALFPADDTTEPSQCESATYDFALFPTDDMTESCQCAPAPAHTEPSQGSTEPELSTTTTTTDPTDSRPSTPSIASLRRFSSRSRPYQSIRANHWRCLQIPVHSVPPPHNAETHPVPPLRPAPYLEAVVEKAWADPTLVIDIDNAATLLGARVVSVIFEVKPVAEGYRVDGECPGFGLSQRRRVPVARIMLGSRLSSLGRRLLQLRVALLLKKRGLDRGGFDVTVSTPGVFEW